ncbi:MAG: DMT family transporter [Pseudomonadota bacterium]
MPDPLVDPPAPETLGAPWRQRWDDLPPSVRGGIIFIVASAIFSLMIALIKLAGERLHVTEILLFRQITMTVIAAPVIIAGWPESMRSERPRLQVARVGVAFLAMTLGFAAIIHLPMAEATVISFSKGFFATILAIIILGEIVRVPRWTALIVGFIGVMVIIWPQDGSVFNLWHLMALISALCVSVVMIFIRILSQIDKPVTILTYQAVGVGVLMIVPSWYYWVTPTLEEWGLLIAIGALSAVAQYLNILAFREGEASALAPLEYTRLVFATALGWWLFTEWPEPRVWFGAAIIVAAALFMLYRERRAGRRTSP